MYRTLLLVGAGSFLGGVGRYALFVFIQQKTEGVFPLGTLAVNIIGCFAIGALFGFSNRSGNLSQEWLLFFTTGLLGGFTTFSAFSNDAILLFRNGQAPQAFLYVGASVILGLAATYMAYQITR